MITEAILSEALAATPSPREPVRVDQADYLALAVALATSGWSVAKAVENVNSLDDNDGALQMLARRRRDLAAVSSLGLASGQGLAPREVLARVFDEDDMPATAQAVRDGKPLRFSSIDVPLRAIAAAQRQDANGIEVFNVGVLTSRQVFKRAGLTNLSDTQAVLNAVERALIEAGHQWLARSLPNVIEADAVDMLDTIDSAADDWRTRGYTSALAEVRDMAAIGRDVMERIADVTREGPMKGWGPMDSPAEIVTDLVNKLEEAPAAAVELIADGLTSAQRLADLMIAQGKRMGQRGDHDGSILRIMQGDGANTVIAFVRAAMPGQMDAKTKTDLAAAEAALATLEKEEKA